MESAEQAVEQFRGKSYGRSGPRMVVELTKRREDRGAEGPRSTACFGCGKEGHRKF